MTPHGSDGARHAHGEDQTPRIALHELRSFGVADYLIRFAFGFGISVVAAIIAHIAGAKVGGLFLAFPAILPATLTLIERREGHAQAVSDVRWATLGAVGMIAYAGVMVGLVRHAPALAIVAAFVAWIVVSVVCMPSCEAGRIPRADTADSADDEPLPYWETHSVGR